MVPLHSSCNGDITIFTARGTNSATVGGKLLISQSNYLMRGGFQLKGN